MKVNLKSIIWTPIHLQGGDHVRIGTDIEYPSSTDDIKKNDFLLIVGNQIPKNFIEFAEKFDIKNIYPYNIGHKWKQYNNVIFHQNLYHIALIHSTDLTQTRRITKYNKVEITLFFNVTREFLDGMTYMSTCDPNASKLIHILSFP